MTPTAIRTVAVLSDIHGVAPALDAVLTEPDVAAAERIVVTGDIAAGPHPVDVLDRLVDVGERVVWVRGNADRELVTLARGGTTAILDPIAPWAAQQLPYRHVALLADLHPVTLQLDGFVCGHTHAVPAAGAPANDHEPRQHRHAVQLSRSPLGTVARGRRPAADDVVRRRGRMRCDRGDRLPRGRGVGRLLRPLPRGRRAGAVDVRPA